jgi:hypothetical protein
MSYVQSELKDLLPILFAFGAWFWGHYKVLNTFGEIDGIAAVGKPFARCKQKTSA